MKLPCEPRIADATFALDQLARLGDAAIELVLVVADDEGELATEHAAVRR